MLERIREDILQTSQYIVSRNAKSKRDKTLILPGTYFHNAGLLNLSAMICFTVCYGFLSAFPYYWLKWWGTALSDITMTWRLSYMGVALLAWSCYAGGNW
jgi:hypothetical protein